MAAYDPYCPRCNPERKWRFILCEGHRRPFWPFTYADLFRLAKLVFVLAVLTWALLLAAFEFAAAPAVILEPPSVSKAEVLPRLPASIQLRRPVQVVVRALIDTQGRASNVVLVESSGSDLVDRLAVQATEAFRYTPGRIGGVPTAMELDFVLSYSPG